MAEQEVVKHSRKILSSVRKPGKWRKKIGEFLLEIFIIVFAITLSLFLERQRENAHEKHIEEEFLTSLKQDLSKDIEELTLDSISYINQQRGFNYLQGAAITKAVNDDSLNKYWIVLNTATNLIPNSSRFEGMKASGLLRVIRDKELLNDIVDLYQEKIPTLLSSTTMFSDYKFGELRNYLINQYEFSNDGVPDLKKIVLNPKTPGFLMMGGAIPGILERYHTVLTQCRLIVSKIEK